jgi:hypothetical protein
MRCAGHVTRPLTANPVPCAADPMPDRGRRRAYTRPVPSAGERVHFYELHESDDELFTDALLAHHQEFGAAEFLGMVMEARARVLGSFEEDSLVTAIAHELQRSHGFLFVDEQRVTAAVNVSLVEADNVLASTEGGRDASASGTLGRHSGRSGGSGDDMDDDDDDEWDADDAEDSEETADLEEDFRSIVLRVDRSDLN